MLRWMSEKGLSILRVDKAVTQRKNHSQPDFNHGEFYVDLSLQNINMTWNKKLLIIEERHAANRITNILPPPFATKHIFWILKRF